MNHKKGNRQLFHSRIVHFLLKNQTPESLRDLEKSNPAHLNLTFKFPSGPPEQGAGEKRLAFQPAVTLTNALHAPCCSNLVLPSGKKKPSSRFLIL